MKENDFIVASLMNPNYDIGMLHAAGLNLDNTQMLDKQSYLQSDFIKNNQLFQDSNGVFSEQKFNNFYNEKLAQWKTFQGIPDGLRYDPFDYRQYKVENAQIKNPTFSISRTANPDESTIGFGFINEYQESPFSPRELAQRNEIYDSKNKTFLEYSPNDHALFSNPLQWFKDIFKEPLVLASYDEDGQHWDPFDKVMKDHKKGDLKINDNGKYYYETLNGRSLAGKQVLSGFDNLTVDGTALNNFDFFDSDDREKSIGGIIMKDALAIAPLFISGPVGTTYIAALTLRELIKTLPMLNGVFAAVNNQDTPFSRLANTLAGKATAATSSTSDYASNSQMNIENVANLMTDVALQWGQQKAIAKAIQELNGMKNITSSIEQSAKRLYDVESQTFRANALKQAKALREAGKIKDAEAIENSLIDILGTEEKWKLSKMGQAYLSDAYRGIENQIQQINRLGADASLLYMALVSNTDVYEDLIDRGLSKREAMAVTLGSTLGMFAVDRTGLGEVFFKELTTEGERAIRASLKNNSKDWINAFAEGQFKHAAAQQVNKNVVKSLVTKGKELGKKLFDDFSEDIKHHSGGFFTKATAEGLEEVSEELAADISKQLYELAADIKPVDEFFGDLTTDNINAFDNIWQDPEKGLKTLGARYGMNFFGGFLGGGIFYGVDAFNGNGLVRNKNNDKLIDVLNNNGVQQVLKVLDEYHKKGKLGSTKLSSDFVEDENGNPVFLSASNDHISQNDFIYNQLRMEILTINKIIHENHLAMSDGQLFDQLTLSEMRFNRLKDYLNGAEYQSGYKQKYIQLVNDYVSYQQQIDNLLHTPFGSSDSDIKAREERDKNVEKLTKLRDEKLQEIENFKSGETAIDYMGKLLFEMDPSVNSAFYTSTFDYWLKLKHNITMEEYDNIDPDEQNKLKEEYLQYKKTAQQLDADEAWEHFKFYGDKIKPELVDIQSKVKTYEDYLKETDKLFDPNEGLLSKVKIYKVEDFSEDAEDDDLKLSYDEYLNGESQEDYDNRNIQLDGESIDDFNQRKANRYSLLQQQEAERKTRESNLERLRIIRDFIWNSGGLLDLQTKRHLLLQIGMRQQDIIQFYIDSLNLSALNRNLSSEFSKILKDVKSLNDLQSVRDSFIELTKKDIDDKIAKKVNTVISIYSKLGLRQPDSINVSQDDLIKALNDKQAEINNALDYLKSIGITDEEYNIDENKLLTFLQTLDNSITNLSDSENISKIDNALYDNGLKELANALYYVKGNIGILKNFNTYNMDLNRNSDNRNLFLSLIFDNPDAVYMLSQHDESDNILWDDVQNQLQTFENTDPLDNFIKEGFDPETYDPYPVYDNSNLESSEVLSDAIDLINNKLQNLENSVNSDVIYTAIEALKNTHPIDNPIMNIVNKLGLALNKNIKNIESLLQSLMESMENDGFNDFTLSPEQRSALQETEDLLHLALSYMISAYNGRNLSTLYPHNQLMNEIIKDHNLQLELMPVIDDSIAPLYSQQIENILQEIELWKDIDAQNAINKTKQFLDTDKKFTQAKLAFFDNNYRRFNDLEITDRTGVLKRVSIFDAYESITEQDPFKRLFKIEQLFYTKIHEIMEQTGASFRQIMEASSIGSLIQSNNNSLINQSTAELNSLITVHKLQPLDIGMYLIMLSGLSANDYYSYLQDSDILKVKNIAPITIQQYTSRMAIAYANDPKLYREGLEWIFSLCKYRDNANLNLIKGLFVSGNGGAGKTKVVLKNIIDFVQSKNIADKSSTWLCAPQEQQINNMADVVEGKQFNPKSLCEELIGSSVYAEMEIHQYDDTSNLSSLERRTSVEGKGFQICNKNITFKTTQKPQIIILDEATHFSSLQLSIISTYCERENIPFILLGDNYQQGYKSNTGFDFNLNPERNFIGHTPRLSITLRDSNYQSQMNVSQLVSLIREFDEIPLGVTRESLIQQAIEKFKKLRITYYNDTELNGDIITTSITSDLLLKIPKKVGSNETKVGILTNRESQYINELKERLGESNITIFNSEVALQGQEFDYIIIDTSWNQIRTDNIEHQHSDTLDFLKRFYTLKTRGKIGSIFIDDRILSTIIKNEKQDFQNTRTNFDAKAIEQLRKYNLQQIGSLNIARNQQTSVQQNTQQQQQQQQQQTTQQLGHASLGLYDNEDLWSSYDEQISQEIDSVVSQDNDTMLDTGDMFWSNEGLVYGESHMLGIPYEKNGNLYTWKVPDRQDGHTLNDIEVFAKPGDITDGKVKDDLVRKLLSFKSILLYGIEPGSGQFKNIYEKFNFADIISEEEFENIFNNHQFKLVVSRPDINKHSFVGYSDLLFSKAAINGDANHEALVYRIVVEFTTVNGEKARITLGQLSNPDTTASNKESIKEGLEYRKGLLQNLNDPSHQKLRQNIDNFNEYFDSYLNEYRKNLNKARDQFEQSGMDEVSISIGDIMFDSNTVIRMHRNALWAATQDENGDTIIPSEEIQKIRLDSFEKDTSHQTSFRHRNPYLVISPVYIYKYIDGSEDMSQNNIRGKAVIFVSRNLALNKEDLLSTWIAEHNNPNGKRSVRMIHLDNAGCTLSDLCNNEYDTIFRTKSNTGKTNHNKLPFENDYMAMRMIVSLHNFRANLVRFKEVLDGQQFDYNILDNVLKQLHELYQQYAQNNSDISETNFRNWVRQQNFDNQEFFDKVWSFNDSCDLMRLRQFRLGTGNENHWQIRMTDVQPNKTYSDEEIRRAQHAKKKDTYRNAVNLIYLDTQGLNSMLQIIDGIYSSILDPLSIEISDGEGNIYQRDQLVDIKNQIINSIQTRSSSGGQSYSIDDSSEDNSLLKFLPIALVRLSSRAMAYSKTIQTQNGLVLPEYGDLPQRNWDWNLSSLITINEYIHPDKGESQFVESHKLNIRNLIEQYGGLLPKILDLCFHGTSNTKGLIDSKLYGKMQSRYGVQYNGVVEPQAFDAYFKDGFLIDPKAEINGFNSSNGGVEAAGGVFARCQESMNPLFLVRAAIDMPRFRFKFNVREQQTQENETQQTNIDTFDNDEQFKVWDINRQIRYLNSGNITQLPKLLEILKSEEGFGSADIDVSQLSFERAFDNIAIEYNNTTLYINHASYSIKARKAEEYRSFKKAFIQALKDLSTDIGAGKFISTSFYNAKVEEQLEKIQKDEDIDTFLDEFVEEMRDSIQYNDGYDPSLDSDYQVIIDNLRDIKDNCM